MIVKEIKMQLKVAERTDLDKFRQMGMMYFMYNPVSETFYEHPIYVHRDTDWKEFFDAFNLRQIYIPMNYFDVQFLNTYYEKKI